VISSAPAVASPTKGSSTGFDSSSSRFTLALMPDTRYLFDADSTAPTRCADTLRWLRENRGGENIAFLAMLGDVTEHGTEQELSAAA